MRLSRLGILAIGAALFLPVAGIACGTIDWAIVKHGPSTVKAGETITYTLDISEVNPNGAGIRPITADLIPAGLTFVGFSGHATSCSVTTTLPPYAVRGPAPSFNGKPMVYCEWANTIMSTRNVGLAVGGIQSVNLTFQVSPTIACGTEIDNVAMIHTGQTDTTYFGGDVNWNNNLSQHVKTTVVCDNTDVTISKSGPSAVVRGSIATYIIAVQNSANIAQNVVVTDPVPAGAVFVPTGSDPTCALQGANVVCPLGSMNPNTSRNVVIKFTVPLNAPCTETTIQNQAQVSTTSAETNTQNNVSNVITTSVTCAGSSSSSSLQSSSLASSSAPSSSSSSLASSSAQSSSAAPSSSSSSLASSSAQSSSLSSSLASSSAQTSSSSLSSSSFSSSSSATGCIRVIKETFSAYGQPIVPVPAFTFRLDDVRIVQNDGGGIAFFTGVTPGTHVVAEQQNAGWNLFSIAPNNGLVTVNAGSDCAVVNFRNQQIVVATSTTNPFIIQTSVPVNVVNNNNVNANANAVQNVNANPTVNVQSNPVAGSNAQFYAQAYLSDTRTTQYIALLPPTGVTTFTGALSGAQGLLAPIGNSGASGLITIIATAAVSVGGALGRKIFGA